MFPTATLQVNIAPPPYPPKKWGGEGDRRLILDMLDVQKWYATFKGKNIKTSKYHFQIIWFTAEIFLNHKV